MLSRMLPYPLDGTLPSLLDLRSPVSSQDAPKYTPGHALKVAPNCSRWHSAILLDCTLWRHSQAQSWELSQGRSQLHSMAHSQPASLYAPKSALNKLSSPLTRKLSSMLLIALDCTLPACLTVHSQVSFQDAVKHTPENALKHAPDCTL